MVKVNQNYKMPVTTPGSKNISAKYHWFREKIASGEGSAKDVNGNEQKSDIFTKGLSKVMFEYLLSKLMGW